MNSKNRKSQQNPASSFAVSAVISISFFVLSGVLAINSVKSISMAYKRSELLGQAQGEVDSLRLKNLELMLEKEKIIGSDYVEEQARDRLNYVMEGEVMIVLPETGDILGASESEVEDVEDEEAGWQRWWLLLREGI